MSSYDSMCSLTIAVSGHTYKIDTFKLSVQNGPGTTKPIFAGSVKVRLKPVCSAAETS